MYRITFPTLEQAANAKVSLMSLVKFRFSMTWLKKDIPAVDVWTICTSQQPVLIRFTEQKGGVLHKLTDEEVASWYCWLCHSELKHVNALECKECLTTQPQAIAKL